MPTWGEILKELTRTQTPQGRDYDGVRRKYLRAVHDHTERAVILYYSAFLESRPVAPADLQIGLQDITGFMEAVSNAEQRELDLILHSSGGSAEAAESIVTYLRKRFDHIRVFVPLAAMSAATMIALSADEIVMGQHSQLGPIDPQFIVQIPEGLRSAPAKAILKQFELAKEECRDTRNLAAWVPILRGYIPGLLTQCTDSRALAVKMVSTWLKEYMFANEDDAESKADAIADWFADYESFQSHGRRVSPEEAIDKGLKVTWLEDDQQLQDAILSVHHATMHTFTGTPATKIVENHLGRAWVRMAGQVMVQGPAPTEPGGVIPPNRAERRRLERGRK
ncbi:serine protease [Chloroflexota bacterium]